MHFADLKDPRRHAHKVEYPLPLLLLIVFAAVLSGFTTWDAFEPFAESKREWLRARCPFGGDDTPSADTLRRVFERRDAKAFAAGFARWARSLGEHMRGRVVAIDGKSLLGARDAAAPTVPLHLLHAWLVDPKLLLGVAAIAGAAREPAEIPALLALLDPRGAIVTVDAIGATRDVTDAIVDRGADYVVQLKRNRGAQHAEVEAHFAVPVRQTPHVTA